MLTSKIIWCFQLHRIYSFFKTDRCSILMFHRVVQVVKIPGIEISEAMFKDIIVYLQNKGYEFISIDTMHKYLLNNKFKHRKYIVLTFDDGYKDNYTFVYPYLLEKKIPFTIYVATDFIDKKSTLWWYLLFDYLKQEREQDSGHIIDVKHTRYKELAKQIRTLNIDQKHEFFSKVFIQNGISLDKYLDLYTLNWNDILEMSDSGYVTIGAHTVAHQNLKNLNIDQVHEEVSASKQIIEERLNGLVRHFAYPYGGYKEAGSREYEALETYDFDTSVTTIEDNIRYKHKHQLSYLPRIPISGEMKNMNEFAVRLSGIYSLKNLLLIFKNKIKESSGKAKYESFTN